MQNAETGDAVLEILRAGKSSQWQLVTDKTAEFPIVIRNCTAETHDVEISVVNRFDWARLEPARFSLGRGEEAQTMLVLASSIEAKIAAGEYNLTLALQDFEGTSLGQLTGSVCVPPYYHIAMSLRVRGPLLRGGVSDGFVVHCRLTNRGNAECSVQLHVDGDGCLAFAAPVVHIPMSGDVSFDIEARWQQNPMQKYPSAIKVYADCPQGQTVAEVAWDDVVESLGSLIPPLQEDEEFPDIFALRAMRPIFGRAGGESFGPIPIEAQAPPASLDSPSIPVHASASDVERALPSDSQTVPMRVQITRKRPLKYTFGRRVNPWWPPAECFGGRWRVKVLPIAAIMLIAAAPWGMSHFKKMSFTRQTTALRQAHPTHYTAGKGRTRKLVVGTHTAVRKVVANELATLHQPRHSVANKLATLHRPHTAVANKLAILHQPRHQVANELATLHQSHHALQPKGSIWEGPVVHVSAYNLKVYDPMDKAARSFIVSQNFKSVFSADGTRSYPMSEVRTGTIVRIFYSYVLGVRHPNAIFIIRQANPTLSSSR